MQGAMKSKKIVCFEQMNRPKFKKQYQMLRQKVMKMGICVRLISKSHLADGYLISWAGN